MNEFRTAGASKVIEYPVFQDFIIIETTKQRLVIHNDEFEYILNTFFNNFKEGKSKYIQILKKWNECIGFSAIEEGPSLINDIEDTIEAFKLIEGVEKEELFKITNKDLKLILSFLVENKNEELKIRKE